MCNYLVLDTETAGTLDAPRVYDIGWVISNARGEVIARRSYVVRETWEKSALMDTAYYAEKVPQYREGIERGMWTVKPLNNIRLALLCDMVEYGVDCIYAYNCDFDRNALNVTIAAYSRGYVETFVPPTVEYRDVWAYAQDIICATPRYVRWAVERDFTTASGAPSTSAENVYRYMTGNDGFIESHTAADDAAIETAILHKARKMPRKGTYTGGSRWRKLKAIRAELGI